MAKYNVHAGHNAKVTGTSGHGLKEHVECRKIKDRVINGMRSQGHTVYDTTDENGTTKQMILSNVVKNSKKNKVDKGISIHMNASNGQGYGVEVWCYDEKGRAEAQRISDVISAATGLRNRGAKISKDLYVIKNVSEPVFLIECYFMDNTTDSNIYKSIGAEKFGDIIVQAVTGNAINESKPPTSNNGPFTVGNYNKDVITTANLNCRKGRGAEYAKVGQFPNGTKVNVWYIGKAKDGSLWGSCSCNKETGYIHMGYVRAL